MKLQKNRQMQEEHERKRRRATERFRRFLEDLRRRKMQQQDRDRRRRWLITLLLALLESKPMQMFFPIFAVAPDRALPKPRPKASRKSDKKSETVDTRTDDERRFLYDYAPRHEEEHLEVYDGLTYADIVEYNRVHRPWLFPAFTPIPGMPKRYSDEPVHVWTLLYEMQHPHARRDAIAALKRIVDHSSHDWINACEKEIDGLSYKDLRRQCMRRTPEATLYEFPRAAGRWREEQRREAEERKREAKETPENNGPKPTGAE